VKIGAFESDTPTEVYIRNRNFNIFSPELFYFNLRALTILGASIFIRLYKSKIIHQHLKQSDTILYGQRKLITVSDSDKSMSEPFLWWPPQESMLFIFVCATPVDIMFNYSKH
jgi:hypothetical protein